MYVINFINQHKNNWRELLGAAPYNIGIKEDDDYVLLKYNQLMSDFSLPIVRECRGLIVKEVGGEWKAVCHAMDKFGNYGESYSAEIDWATARVLEKIDGSLIKLWYDRGCWHVSTNSTINAENANTTDGYSNFREVFNKTIQVPFKEFTLYMDKNKTYYFELTSPETIVTIEYDYGLYYLGERDMNTQEEYIMSNEEIAFMWMTSPVRVPKSYPFNSLKEVVASAQKLSSNEEGYVVVDANFNRIKVKSAEYLAVFHAINNNVITVKRVINMIDNETIDDFKGYANRRLRNYAERVEEHIRAYIFILDHFWVNFSFLIKDKKNNEIINLIKTYDKSTQNYLFYRWKRGGTGRDYFDQMPVSTRVDIIKKLMEES